MQARARAVPTAKLLFRGHHSLPYVQHYAFANRTCARLVFSYKLLTEFMPRMNRLMSENGQSDRSQWSKVILPRLNTTSHRIPLSSYRARHVYTSVYLL